MSEIDFSKEEEEQYTYCQSPWERPELKTIHTILMFSWELSRRIF